jgi:biopolymer transport protein ExbD
MTQPADEVRSTAVVTVDESGNAAIEGQPISADQLGKRLQAIGLPRDAKIIIRSNGEAPAEAVAKVVEALGKAGYEVSAGASDPPRLVEPVGRTTPSSRP